MGPSYQSTAVAVLALLVALTFPGSGQTSSSTETASPQPTQTATTGSEPEPTRTATREPQPEPTPTVPPDTGDLHPPAPESGPTRLDGMRPPGGIPAPPDGLEIGDEIPGQYVVALTPGADPASVARTFQSKGLRLQATFSTATRGFAAKASAGTVRRLRGDPRVVRVEPDRVVGPVAIQTSPTWGLDRSDQRDLPLSGSYTYSNSAGRVLAYVIDTGIRADHDDFGGRVATGFDAFATGSTSDCQGHGTHVAGTLGGAAYGVAKGVTLMPVRVLDCDGFGSTSSVIAGVDWVTQRRQAQPGVPAVANMSLGGGASSMLDTAVRNSIAAGVTYVVAAGNSNADACNQSPARVAEAITVGATDNADTRASFSNYGICLDLFAPGVSITSAGISTRSAIATSSGTSMASPHVAGAAALFLHENTSASPAAVTEAILSAATSGTVAQPGGGSPNSLLYSRLDAGSEDATSGPDPVSGLEVSAGIGKVTLSWRNPSDPDLAGVEVRMAAGLTPPATSNEGTLVYSGPATSVTKGKLGQGRDYSFSVFTRDANPYYSEPVSTVAYGSAFTTKAPKPRRLTYTASTVVEGSLTLPGPGRALTDVPVDVEARPSGRKWRRLSTVGTSSTGSLQSSHSPARNTAYRLRFRGGGNVLGSLSGIRTVVVRPLVTAAFAKSDGKVLLRGKVAPGHRGQTVVLQRRRDGRWRKVSQKSLSRYSRYRFRLPTNRTGTFTYRVVKPKDADHIFGFSGRRTLKVE